MKIRWLFIGILVFAGGYAAAAIANQAKLAGDTEFEYAGYKVISIGQERMQIKLSLWIVNKTSLSFKVFNQQYRVSVNNIEVASVSEWRRVAVPANGKAITELVVEFSPRQMVSTLWNELIRNMGNASIRLKGKVSVLTFGFVYARIPVDTTFTLKNFKAV